MQFTLYKQKPIARRAGVRGNLSVHDNAAYLFDSRDLPIAELLKPEIVFINQDGIFLRGFEPNGFDKSGRPKYLYQEWLLSYGEVE